MTGKDVLRLRIGIARVHHVDFDLIDDILIALISESYSFE